MDRAGRPDRSVVRRQRLDRRAAECWYTLTPDENFVIGAHPVSDRVLLACGFSGHGFKFTPVVGEVLADLVVDGATRFDLSLFDPLRFGS